MPNGYDKTDLISLFLIYHKKSLRAKCLIFIVRNRRYIMSREAVVVSYGRSPVCRAFKGSFKDVHPIDYSAQVLNAVVDNIHGLDKNDIEDVIMGCSVHHKTTSMNIARSVVLRSNLPESAAGLTINRFCSSGLQAIAIANASIIAGQGDVIIAGGVEDMSNTFEPYPIEYQNKWLNDHDKAAYIGNGITAENIVKKYGITREEMDQLAVDSHAKADAANKAGKLAPSIVPITITDENGQERIVKEDEGIRPGTSLEKLATLKPCFIPLEEGGTVTAATSSQTSDAAAFVALMESEKAKEIGAKPIAKMLSFAVAGCDPKLMGLGPIYAVPKALKRAGITVDDLDVIEINEAFAAQMIACIRDLKLPMEKINPYGGAMALGHPLGATGAILTAKALDYLKDTGGKYALVTMCIGGGMGAAGVYELL